MRVSLDEIGVNVQVTTEDGITVEGWIRGELRDGLLIALDRKGRDIRLVQNVQMVSYNWKDRADFAIPEAKSIVRNLNKLDSALKPRLDRAFAALDYRPIRRFAERAPRLRDALQRTFHEPASHFPEDETPLNQALGYLSANTDQTVELHADIFHEMERSQLTKVIAEFREEISHLPVEHTIPSFDLEFRTRSELRDDVRSTRDLPWTLERHQSALTAAQRMREQLIGAALLRTRRRRDDTRERDRKPPSEDNGSSYKWAGAGLRIIAGTALTAGNAALGLTAGLATTIVSIGATAVPTYVGVATSMYTGLVQVADGLEKIGEL